MNPLSLLPPELAHGLALAALRRGIYPLTPTTGTEHPVTLLGRTLRNPIGLAAGADKQGAALDGWARLGFGFVEAGTVTLEPRPGNPRPRLWRFRCRQGLVNWLGLPGPGLAPVQANLRAFRDRKTPLGVGVSIASPGNRPEEFRTLSRELAPLADYLALNASCPNLAHTAPGIGREMSDQVRAVIDEAGACPVLVKLGPTRNEDILRVMVESALESGASGFIATNTLPHALRSLLHPRLEIAWPTIRDQPVGGYSGPELLDISTWMIASIRRAAGPDAALIGVGGIHGGADALSLMDAGADAVQLYTALTYQGAAVVRRILSAMYRT